MLVCTELQSQVLLTVSADAAVRRAGVLTASPGPPFFPGSPLSPSGPEKPFGPGLPGRPVIPADP